MEEFGKSSATHIVSNTKVRKLKNYLGPIACHDKNSLKMVELLKLAKRRALNITPLSGK